MASGIYEIVHIETGHRYVGSAIDLDQRWYHHKYYADKRQHGNKHFERAWHKYGKEAFEFRVIEYVENPENLVAREQFHIDQGTHYNMAPVAGSMLGWKHSDDVKRTISDKAKKAWADPNYKESMVVKAKKRSADPTERARLSEIAQQRAQDPEVIEYQRKLGTERAQSQEWRENIGNKNAVHWENDEYRAKGLRQLAEARVSPKMAESCREASLKKWTDPQYRANHTASMSNPETREKMRAAKVGKPQSEETKLKRAQSLKAYWAARR